MDHQTKDTHLGGTAIVQFDGTLLHLPVIRLFGPAKVKGAVTEVTLEIGTAGAVSGTPGSDGLVLVGSLHHRPGGDHLCPDHTGDSIQGGKATGDVFGTGETDTCVCDEVTNDGKPFFANQKEI